jgi:hypothetical protein
MAAPKIAVALHLDDPLLLCHRRVARMERPQWRLKRVRENLDAHLDESSRCGWLVANALHGAISSSHRVSAARLPALSAR